jgi:hypothetical protein
MRIGPIRSSRPSRKEDEVGMLDILFMIIGLAFLGGAMLYAVACDRL